MLNDEFYSTTSSAILTFILIKKDILLEDHPENRLLSIDCSFSPLSKRVHQ